MSRSHVCGYLSHCAELIAGLDQFTIQKIAESLLQMWIDGGKVLVCGNGGSAASAAHICVDLTKCINVTLRETDVLPFRALALATCAPTLTCLGNDLGYENVFAEQAETWWNPLDRIIAISGSGNSPNVLRAVEVIRERTQNSGVKQIIGLTGYDGGKLGDMVDLHLNVPVADMQLAEDAHMVALHCIFREVLRLIHERINERTALVTAALAKPSRMSLADP